MSFFKIVGVIVAALISLGSAAMTIFLFSVGSSNNWTSDGPGMLLIMIGVGLFALIAVSFFALTMSLITTKKSER